MTHPKDDKDWDGTYVKDPYIPMDRNEFHILRPPTTKRYLKAKAMFKRVEQEEIDKRWNLWHHWFKRVLLYKLLRRLMKVIK